MQCYKEVDNWTCQEAIECSAQCRLASIFNSRFWQPLSFRTIMRFRCLQTHSWRCIIGERNYLNFIREQSLKGKITYTHDEEKLNSGFYFALIEYILFLNFQEDLGNHTNSNKDTNWIQQQRFSLRYFDKIFTQVKLHEEVQRREEKTSSDLTVFSHFILIKLAV